MSYLAECFTRYPIDPADEPSIITRLGLTEGQRNMACAEVDRLRVALAAREGQLAAMRAIGTRFFPGFSLCESPIRVQRLGFSWLDQKGQHRTFEMAIMDNHPLMVANQLKQLAEGIEEAHSDPKSPLGRADAMLAERSRT